VLQGLGKEHQYFQWNKRKDLTHRLDNGFIGNTWRIQMIRTAKAFAEQPGRQGGI